MHQHTAKNVELQFKQQCKWGRDTRNNNNGTIALCPPVSVLGVFTKILFCWSPTSECSSIVFSCELHYEMMVSKIGETRKTHIYSRKLKDFKSCLTRVCATCICLLKMGDCMRENVIFVAASIRIPVKFCDDRWDAIFAPFCKPPFMNSMHYQFLRFRFHQIWRQFDSYSTGVPLYTSFYKHPIWLYCINNNSNWWELLVIVLTLCGTHVVIDE